MKPSKFTIRDALIALTVAALGLGYYRQTFMQRPVTKKATESIRQGMTAWEIRWELGAPHKAGSGLSPTWRYDLADGSGCFLVVLDEDRAAVVLLEKYLSDDVDSEAL